MPQHVTVGSQNFSPNAYPSADDHDAISTTQSHRIASQPLLSDVSVEKDKDELGEKDSALPQTSGYCASQPARVLKHAEKITVIFT